MKAPPLYSVYVVCILTPRTGEHPKDAQSLPCEYAQIRHGTGKAAEKDAPADIVPACGVT